MEVDGMAPWMTIFLYKQVVFWLGCTSEKHRPQKYINAFAESEMNCSTTGFWGSTHVPFQIGFSHFSAAHRGRENRERQQAQTYPHQTDVNEQNKVEDMNE